MKEEMLSKNKKRLMIVLSILIIVLLIFNAIISNRQGKEEQQQETTTNTENWINTNLVTDLEELASKSALDRMKYYLDKFLFFIEERDYETAYQMLYDEFKTLYFPTLDSFKTYVTKKYPAINTLEYKDYDKLGNYHILTVEISDIINATENYTPKFTQKFVILENGLNDFKMSFQAK